MEAHRSCLEVSGNWRADTSHSAPTPPHAASRHHSAAWYQLRALTMSVITKFQNKSLLRLSLLTPQPMWLSLQKMRCQLMLIMLRIMWMTKEMTHWYPIQNLNPLNLVNQVKCVMHLCQMMMPDMRDQRTIVNLRVLIQWASPEL